MSNSAYFALTDLKTAQPISGWQDFLHEGEAFLKTAAGAYRKGKRVFTAEILYNIIAMAVEKFVMAALMKHGAMPYNHTMKDLVEAMEQTFPAAFREVKEDLLIMDSYQDICDLEGFRIIPPEMSKIPAMLELSGKVQVIANRLVSEAEDINIECWPGK